MKKGECLALLWLLAACGPRSTAPDAEASTAVRRLLAEQTVAWNEGDIERFMEGYWRSEELRFVSGGEVRRGFDETLARYRATYPDRAAMGRLTFEDLDVRILSPQWAMVHGIYRLEREGDAPWGRFTLLLERRQEGWRIVHDHTSRGT